MRHTIGIAVLAGLTVTASWSLVGAQGVRDVRTGGTFRVALCSGAGPSCVTEIDPALSPAGAGTFGGDALVQQPTCASLVRYPDKAPPAGYRLVPELATALPRISGGGRIYAFRIRKGLRFSNGAPVTGRDVAHALDRILDPRVQSLNAPLFSNIVGAQEVMEGHAATPAGVTATRTTITFRLKAPDGAFSFILTGLCVVPSGLPADPEGVGAPIPSAGPYYVSRFVAGRQVVLERNRYYRGSRPHHVARFVFDLEGTQDTILDRVKRGTADWGWVSTNVGGPLAAGLARRYGVNKRQFFVHRGLFLRMFVLNTSRPLFRNNAGLRRAVNFAIDRRTLTAQRGPLSGTPTDHYLSPDYPGYRHVRIYPLRRPNVARARALARGHTRSGKAVLYVPSSPPEIAPAAIAQGQIVRRNLRKIGIDVTIQKFPANVLFEKLATPGEPFDLAWIGFSGIADAGLIDCLFNGRWIGKPEGCNYSYFDSPEYNRRLSAASRLTGNARTRAFGQLDLELARDAAPAVAYSYDNALTLVSKRTGCIILNPWLDLAAVCLKS